jgi:hydrogen peroxide-dependent heme synthase
VSESVEAVVSAEGWGVLHLYFRLAGDRRATVALADAEALVEAFEAEEPYQAHWSATLGARADVGLLLIGPDIVRLQRFHRDLLATELGTRLAEVPELSFLSMTELAEYTPRGDEPRLVAMREARLHPRLPTRRLTAFYPMSKRRTGRDNWYELKFEERLTLMEGHGRIGRTYAGRILQLITGSTGLSDWEWGVTLLADDMKDLKDIVHEMRFDTVSSRYGEFGPFTVGLAAPFGDALALAGVRSA